MHETLLNIDTRIDMTAGQHDFAPYVWSVGCRRDGAIGCVTTVVTFAGHTLADCQAQWDRYQEETNHALEPLVFAGENRR